MIPWQISFAIKNQITIDLGIPKESENDTAGIIPLYNRMRDAQDSDELVWAVILVLHHVIDYVAVAGLCSEATIKQHNDECARLRAGNPSLKMIGQVADSLKHVNKTERQSKGQFNRVVKSSDFNNFWEITDFFGKKNSI